MGITRSAPVILSPPLRGGPWVAVYDPGLKNGHRRVTVAIDGNARIHEGPLDLEDASAKLSGALRVLLAQPRLELDHLQTRIDEADAVIKKTAEENEACRPLVAIPGIGPVTATAIIAAIGNGAALLRG